MTNIKSCIFACHILKIFLILLYFSKILRRHIFLPCEGVADDTCTVEFRSISTNSKLFRIEHNVIIVRRFLLFSGQMSLF